MIILRDYQEKIKIETYAAWNEGFKNVLLVMPTGAGKTKTFCSIVIDKAVDTMGAPKLPTVIMVHRKELVQQICLTLAEERIPHNIIAPRNVIKGIIQDERRTLGYQLYNPQANVTVISVDTLNARFERYKQWAQTIRLWVTDEAAHLLEGNKWGRAVKYFPNAIGLGVTATPERLDKKGLGSHVDGVFDTMVEGPNTKWLIEQGYLSKYKIAIPPSDYSDYLSKASSGSDFSKKSMIEASSRSRITGDVVKSYKQHADGKQAILFGTDIKTIQEMEKNFLDAGVIAKSLSGNTPDRERLDTLIKFKNKEIQVLLNVDLFDEGLDVPGIECVIMARPTMSLGKFLQMVGRGLRKAEGKPHLILIDHVGNIAVNHGLPDTPRRWSLDRVAKRGIKLNFVRICSNINCNAPYDRVLSECPYCGAEAIVKSRDGGGGRTPPEKVDGDLYLIDPETLRDLERDTQLEAPASVAQRVSAAAGGAAGLKALNNQSDRINKQKELVQVIASWAGVLKNRRGYNDRGIHKYFYLIMGMTITEALAESKKDMQRTIDKLQGDYAL